MNYIITQDEKKAKDISEGLWKVRRPNPNPKDVTKYLYEWIKHPTDGRTAMQFELTEGIPIRSDEGLRLIAEAFVGSLPENPTQQEIDEYNKDIDNMEKELEKLGKELDKGESIKLDKILPAGYTVLTEAEMESDGWFQGPQI